MASVEWNKKEELVAEQALKHLRTYSPLLAAVAKSAMAELSLLVKIQEYCYDNMNFMKSFQKIVVMLYKSKQFHCLRHLLWLFHIAQPEDYSVFCLMYWELCLTVWFHLSIAEVIREEVILKWYKDAHSSKGKSVFLEQMKKFVEWLENASEG